jgi:membrane protein implicated in regulation of membrane protease activity
MSDGVLTWLAVAALVVGGAVVLAFFLWPRE